MPAYTRRRRRQISQCRIVLDTDVTMLLLHTVMLHGQMLVIKAGTDVGIKPMQIPSCTPEFEFGMCAEDLTDWAISVSLLLSCFTLNFLSQCQQAKCLLVQFNPLMLRAESYRKLTA